ncbi:MAG: hypothetical protein IPM97_03500 [Bdellovibrionaceae bacterium]|nr:hypothetical protein [Pseudobdellovibrionaceae bacterium]
MVHQPECGKNTPYVIDFIKITLSAKLLNPEEIRVQYVEKGLSIPQIAKLFHVSKSMIRVRLHAMGIRDGMTSGRNLNPENYRCPVAPYGYQVQAGKLIPNKRELQICRNVVNLINRDGFTQSKTARELARRGYKTRAGKSKWDSKTIFNMYKRWNGKI